MGNVLLGLWIALIGADRIDLAGGAFRFVLTPFLALTPFVAVSELWRRHREGRAATISRAALTYCALAAGLVTIVLASVLVAGDTTIAASRAALLTADIGATFLVAFLSAGRRDAARTLARGAAASLVLFVVFDVVESLVWIGRTSDIIRVGSVTLHFGDLQRVGPLPRLGGPGTDANRSGFVLLFFGVLIAVGEPRPVLRRVALTVLSILVLATFSRSTAIAVVTTLTVAALLGRVVLSPKSLAIAGVVVSMLTGLALARPDAFLTLVDAVTSPALDRLSPNEGSARGHLALLQRGFAEATESVPRAAIGLGFGTSHLVLQDMFPGNKYGNFHSLYISMFAESGIFALLIVLVLIITPLVVGGPWRPLVAGVALFNVFYQTPVEPAFWFVLASAWLTMPRGRRPVRAASVAGGET